MSAVVPTDRLLVGRPRSGRGLVRIPVPASADAGALVAAVDQAWRLGYQGVDLDGPELLSRRDLRPLLRQPRRRGLSLGLRSADLQALASPAVALGVVEAMNLRRVRLVGDAARSLPIMSALVDAGVSVTAELDGAPMEPPPEGVTPLLAWRGRSDPTALAAWAASGAPPGLMVEGLPACLHPLGVPRSMPLPALEGGRVVDADPDRVKPPGCAGCVEHPSCAGVPVDWYRGHGDAALRPIRAEGPGASGGAVRGVPTALAAPDRRPVESARLDVAPRYPDVALVTLMVPGCDLACIFCETPQADPMSVAFSTPQSVSAALRAQAGRAGGVFFTGGEPTQLPWLMEAISEARDLGYARIQMQTHAGRAAEPAFARALVAAGLTAIDVPIYGPDAATHEAITHTPGSFERTLAGLEGLRALGVAVVAHTTIFQSNLGRLADTLAHLDGLGLAAIYLQVAGEVGAPGTWHQVSPHPVTVGAQLVAALAERELATPLTLSDLAPCQVPGLEATVPSWRGPASLDAPVVVLPYGEWLMVFTAGATRAHAPRCTGCALRDACDGVPVEVLGRYGDGAVRPR